MLEIAKELVLGTATADSGGGATINNEDITITSNGEYTASEGYTGIGTATVNVPQPTGTISITANGTADVNDYQYADVNVPQYEERTVTNATGSAVSSGDKVWVNGNQIVDYIDVDTVSGIAKDNFTAGTQTEQLTVTGSLTNSDGILSGFSASNYAVLDDKGILPSFEILTKININHTDYYGSVLDNAFHFIRVGGGKIGIYNATDGSIANFSFTTNKWYWCKGVFNGTSYTLYCLEDNGYIESQLPPLSSWSVAGTTTNISGVNLNNVYVGADGGYLSNYLHGEINIEATKITSNGAIIWQYYKYTGGGTGKVGIGELGKKYGATINNFLGDVNASGVLQKPTTANLVFNGVEDLSSGSLAGAYYIQYSSNQGGISCLSVASVSFPDLTHITGGKCLYQAFQNQETLTSISFPKLETINSSTVSGEFSNAFYGTGITKVEFPKLKTISSFYGVFNYAFQVCNNLVEASFPELETCSSRYGFQYAFNGCNSLTTVNFSKLKTVGKQCFQSAFGGCTSLTTLSFPALRSDSFGYNTDMFSNMLWGVTGCTVHFPSNLQSVIGSWSDVTNGFGGTNTTVLWDLSPTE